MEHDETMTLDMHDFRRKTWWRFAVILLAITLVGLAGCTQIGRMFGARPPQVTVTPAPVPASSAPAPPVAKVKPVPPLQTIIVQELEQGHYAKGRQQLHRYIRQHPDDLAARDMWKQLTADPEKMLGSRSRIHVVKPGDTYSSLAAKFLGDPGQFLILARYNHAPDPSLLHVGQQLRIPLDAHLKVAGGKPAQPGADQSVPASAASVAASETSMSKAEQLQQQSVDLLDQGHHQQAMDRMAQALDLDPKLKSPGGKADNLRQQLLASYHQRAIILYRDQKLSQAIGLWDKILAIDPGYEPAIIYRARARELQSRLKQL